MATGFPMLSTKHNFHINHKLVILSRAVNIVITNSTVIHQT